MSQSIPEENYIGEKGQYQLIGLFYTGGFANIYLARSSENDFLYIVKKLKPQYKKNPEISIRFDMEIDCLEILRGVHPCIISFIDKGITPEKFLVLEYVHGMTLAQLFKTDYFKNNFTFEHCALIFYKLADALLHIHCHNFIHRDAKPENILISNDFKEIKLIDFNIVKSYWKIRITRSGQFVGSDTVMSPEQIWDGYIEKKDEYPLDRRTDIYSLGIVLYQLLNKGVPPFPEDLSSEQLVAFHLYEIPKPIDNIPEILNNFVLKMLMKKPKDRFYSMNSVKFHFRKVLMAMNEHKAFKKISEFEVDQNIRTISSCPEALAERTFGQFVKYNLLRRFDHSNPF